MNFLKKIKGNIDHKVQQIFYQNNNKANKKQNENNTVSIVQSDSLHMTIIDDQDQNKQNVKALSPQQWVLILHNGDLNGFSFQRIYFSFLKGIPNYLRYKIWIFFSSQNSTKKFRLSAKNLPEKIQSKFEKSQKNQKGQIYLNIDKITIQIYQLLTSLQPLETQKIQINKDVHRTYSTKPQYKFTSELLKKMLFALSNSGIQYSQGMNYILLNVIIYCLQSIGINNEQLFKQINTQIQKNIFIILRQIVIRMDVVFGNNNIFKVIKQLQQKIAESVPQILFLIYKLGMDCFSMFSQHYFSLLCYNDSTQELNKLMMDLFFVVGQKAIHAILVQMLQVSRQKILSSTTPQDLNQYIKKQLFMEYAKVLEKQRSQATKLQDFGLSFYQNTTLRN